MTINCNGKLLNLSIPKVMGIVNLNNDSFFAESRSSSFSDIIRKISTMLDEGADIIDLGVMSSRPGALVSKPEDEIRIYQQILHDLTKTFPDSIFSVDTIHSKVAKFALDCGIGIINDISGGKYDNEMHKVVGQYKAPYVCMHMRGVPENMQTLTEYHDIQNELIDYFIDQKSSTEEAGIKDLIIDLGFGFSKSIPQNFYLLNKLENFKMLNLPILVGVSRKSMIYKTLGIEVENSLNGTSVLHTIALLKGANILRVHDVGEAKQALTLVETLNKS